MRHALAFSCAVALPLYEAAAQEVSAPHRVWTLEDCISYALEHNIEIKRQELVSEDRQTALSEARWSYAPTFSAGSSYTLSSGRVLDETTYDFVENETVGSSSVSVSGNIEVFAGLRKHRELQRAKLDLKAGLQDLESARYDLRANVTAAFLEVLCARESITEARQIVSMLEVQEEKTRIKVEAGKVTEADLLQITAQLYSARNDVLTAENDYDMARLELCQLLEIEDFRDFEAAPSAADAIPSLVPEDEGGILEAVGWRPEIKSAELGVELARKDLQIARSSYWPTVSLSAGYGTSHSGARQMMLQNPDGSFRYEAYPFFRQYADNASSYVSLSLNIPILSGLSVRKNVRRTKTALRDAEYALASTRKGIVKISPGRDRRPDRIREVSRGTGAGQVRGGGGQADNRQVRERRRRCHHIQHRRLRTGIGTVPDALGKVRVHFQTEDIGNVSHASHELLLMCRCFPCILEKSEIYM